MSSLKRSDKKNMKISRELYGQNTEIELSRDELKKAAVAYEKITAREALERYLKVKKGVISLDVYEMRIDQALNVFKKSRAGGKEMTEALNEAMSDLNRDFDYMEFIPGGVTRLFPGFSSYENYKQDPERVCFCHTGQEVNKEWPGWTGEDFREVILNGDKFQNEALFLVCSERHPDLFPRTCWLEHKSEVLELADELKRARENEAKAKAVTLTELKEREEALSIYKDLRSKTDNERKLFTIAMGADLLLREHEGLSPEHAIVLAQKAYNMEPSAAGSFLYEECLQAVSSILDKGLNHEMSPLLPELDTEGALALLLSASPDAFRAAVENVELARQEDNLKDSSHYLLQDPGLEDLVRQVDWVKSGHKQGLDSLVQAAKGRTGIRPTNAPAEQAREL